MYRGWVNTVIYRGQGNVQMVGDVQRAGGELMHRGRRTFLMPGLLVGTADLSCR